MKTFLLVFCVFTFIMSSFLNYYSSSSPLLLLLLSSSPPLLLFSSPLLSALSQSQVGEPEPVGSVSGGPQPRGADPRGADQSLPEPAVAPPEPPARGRPGDSASRVRCENPTREPRRGEEGGPERRRTRRRGPELDLRGRRSDARPAVRQRGIRRQRRHMGRRGHRAAGLPVSCCPDDDAADDSPTNRRRGVATSGITHGYLFLKIKFEFSFIRKTVCPLLVIRGNARLKKQLCIFILCGSQFYCLINYIYI